jgi:hypothetical protein
MSDPPIHHGIARTLGLTDPPSTDKTHYEALGRFIASFANVEGVLHVIARKLSGLNDDKARLVFGGMRLTDIIDRIRSFLHLDQADGKSDETFHDIEACLEQLGHISSRRHNIVHRGATYFEGTFIVTNSMIAKTLAGIESELVSERTLKDMALDCDVIFLRLVAISNLMSPRDDNWIATLRNRAWLYKPPPPKPQNPKRRGNPESPKPPPGASRA